MKGSLDEDFRLCSKACDKATSKYGGTTPIGVYPEAEGTVVLVWTVTGIIENGGFTYLFGSPLPGDNYYTFTIEAFERIGCIKAANAIKEATALLVEHSYDNQHGWIPEKKKDEMKDFLDIEFCDEIDNITRNLAQYIRAQRLDEM